MKTVVLVTTADERLNVEENAKLIAQSRYCTFWEYGDIIYVTDDSYLSKTELEEYNKIKAYGYTIGN